MTQGTDRPQYAPGDKVRITIDATVAWANSTHMEVQFVDITDHVTGDVVTDEVVLPHVVEGITVHRADMDAKPIDVLGFTPRVWSALMHGGVRTVGALLKQRPEDLTDIRNFGTVALAEVMATLGKRGLELQETFVPLRAETVRVMAEIGDKS